MPSDFDIRRETLSCPVRPHQGPHLPPFPLRPPALCCCAEALGCRLGANDEGVCEDGDALLHHHHLQRAHERERERVEEIRVDHIHIHIRGDWIR